ncbi:MAG TPA: sulfite exporter TauE/SafE family protein [Longimicrobium sp.]|nr:sulfite exporter TauE/SafE family protein [Longimicrobium sp.]
MTEPGMPRDGGRPLLAFGFAVPIAMLGGLIGLGGAEFRLPVLAGPLRHPVRRAVPLNLAVSLVTLATAAATRGRTLSPEALRPFAPVLAAMAAASVAGALAGTALHGRLSSRQLERLVMILLLAIGVALVLEGLLDQPPRARVPDGVAWRAATGAAFGLAIGVVSSLLGVAGGELIIPTFVFAYGAGIKTAGSASLLIGLATVTAGIVRYARQGAYRDRAALRGTVAPMAAGSVLGAVAGGLLVGVVSSATLKVGLGVILVISAVRTFRHRDR